MMNNKPRVSISIETTNRIIFIDHTDNKMLNTYMVYIEVCLRYCFILHGNDSHEFMHLIKFYAC